MQREQQELQEVSAACGLGAGGGEEGHDGSPGGSETAGQVRLKKEKGTLKLERRKNSQTTDIEKRNSKLKLKIGKNIWMLFASN